MLVGRRPTRTETISIINVGLHPGASENRVKTMQFARVGEIL